MVSSRKSRSESSSGDDFEPFIDPEIQQLFEEFDGFGFPPMDFEPPPEKTLKERILEQHRARVEAIKEHERKYATEPYVPDVIFFRRNDRDFDSYETEAVNRTNIFREDEDSLDSIDEPEPYLNSSNLCDSNFEDLHEPRRRVVWNKSTQDGFQQNNHVLNTAMKRRGIPRIPNAKKRFENIAKANLRLERLSREDVERLDPEEEDPFGHMELLPNTFTKSEKSPTDRKRDVVERYVDLLQDFDYSNRSGNREKEEFNTLVQRKEELEMFLEDPSLERIPGGSPYASRTVFKRTKPIETHDSRYHLDDMPSTSASISKNEETGYISDVASDDIPRTSISLATQRSYENYDADDSIQIIEIIEKSPVNSVPITKPREKETLKRKITDGVESEAVPKKIDMDYRQSDTDYRQEKERRPSAEALRDDAERNRKSDQNCEEVKRERERRREATQKMDEEFIENQRKAKELQERKQAEEREAAEKRKAEAKEFEERQERIRIELAKKKKAEEENLRRRKQEEEDRRNREANEREMMKLRQEMERQQRIVDMQEANAAKALAAAQADTTPVSNPVLLTATYDVANCKRSEEQEAIIKQRLERYCSMYGLPSAMQHRELELRAMCAKVKAMGGTKLVIIPQENNAKTKVYPMTRPRIVPAARIAPPAPRPAPVPVRPELAVARCQDIEKVLREIRALMAPTRKAIAARVPVYEQEVDYQTCKLHKLKMCIAYPFKPSDGMYWPLFFGLRDSRPSTHVAALTRCLSFSGKFASFTLLTASLEDEDRKNPQKFETSYADSGGDWADYSQKPGRFSNRIGFKAHRNKCKDTFDIQRARAKQRMASQFAEETEEYQNFGRYYNEYEERRDRTKYNQKLSVHLRELVRDARIDMYSLRETFKDVDAHGHPGTRESLLDIWWYAHGYRHYLETRDREYGHYMSEACKRYESMLPSRYICDKEKFNEWCFQPMLASLYYQLRYKPFDVFSRKDMSRQFDRYRKYNQLFKEKKFNLKQALYLCRLNEYDKKQWTILNDQLAAQFKDFPAVFSLMFDPNCDLIRKTERAAQDAMRTVYRDRSNNWDYIKTTFSQYQR